MIKRMQSARFKQIVGAYLYQTKGRLGLAALCLLGFTIMELFKPWPIKIILDHILLDKALSPSLSFLEGLLQSGTMFSLTVISSSILIIAMLSGGFSYFQLYISSSIGYQLSYLLRRELFARLQQLSLSFHDRARSGELLTKLSGDTKALKDLFADWALTTAGHLLMFIGMFIIMFVLNWQLSLVILATLPVLVMLLFPLNRKIKATVSQQRKQEGKIVSRVNEVLASISLVQAFGREGYEEDRLEVASARNLEMSVQTARTAAAMTKTVALVSAVGTAGTVLFGSWQVIKGRMTPGDLLIFISYVKNLYAPVRNMAKLSAKVSRAMVSVDRIAEVLDYEPEIRDHPQSINASNLQGDIRFQNVNFGYDNGTKVLNHVSFHLHPGQRVALVGASGVGKSTIVKLLLRLYEPQEGNIFIDGVSITQYQRESLRREIGIVLQDTMLLGVSIEENISYGKPEATREEVEEAARLAHAHDFIVSLPDGYDTILGERGNTLSGGERQRICLARAIIKHPSILILDEPTSAVDPVSASLIRDAIAAIQEGKTTLFIAHQFSSMQQFDQILVLKDGQIIEYGLHGHLLDLKGHYYELYHRQIA